mmetsp:Transcript_151007/g.485297  ORF Transcript_151007/g.485297 Transcript_151007/m.485297 type:complete len:213 (-) Transcript_151007:1129-1767(-)
MTSSGRCRLRIWKTKTLSWEESFILSSPLRCGRPWSVAGATVEWDSGAPSSLSFVEVISRCARTSPATFSLRTPWSNSAWGSARPSKRHGPWPVCGLSRRISRERTASSSSPRSSGAPAASRGMRLWLSCSGTWTATSSRWRPLQCTSASSPSWPWPPSSTWSARWRGRRPGGGCRRSSCRLCSAALSAPSCCRVSRPRMLLRRCSSGISGC